MNFCNELDYCRYCDILGDVLTKLDSVEILYKDFDSGHSGYVDIDVLLKDGRVFSYNYLYGSCSGCDEWECRNLPRDDIEKIMKQEATFFDSLEQYKKWSENIVSRKEIMRRKALER